MLQTSNLPWPSEVGIGFIYPCRPPHAMVAQVEKGFCLYSTPPLSKTSPLEALNGHHTQMAVWRVGKTGTLPPFPTPGVRGLRSYQAQAAGSPPRSVVSG